MGWLFYELATTIKGFQYIFPRLFVPEVPSCLQCSVFSPCFPRAPDIFLIYVVQYYIEQPVISFPAILQSLKKLWQWCIGWYLGFNINTLHTEHFSLWSVKRYFKHIFCRCHRHTFIFLKNYHKPIILTQLMCQSASAGRTGMLFSYYVKLRLRLTGFFSESEQSGHTVSQ